MDRTNRNPEILLYTGIGRSPYFYGSRRHGVAMVPIEYADLGTQFELETPHGGTSAMVVEEPFITPVKAEQQLSPSAAGETKAEQDASAAESE
jgi:hypothetical protein